MIIKAILGGFDNVLSAITSTVNDDFVRQLPTITDHSHSINTLTERFNQLVLQGESVVYTSNGLHYPGPNIVAIEFILIAAGAGGGSGRWDVLTDKRCGGGGGGGAGETHFVVPSAMLDKEPDGRYSPIPIVIGAHGDGGPSSGLAGSGGGNTYIGSGTNAMLAGGGVGGQSTFTTSGSPGGPGGVGMIPGGDGGRGAVGQPVTSTAGANSVSPYSLNGGGGGGGGGGNDIWPGSQGGAGGISRGGIPDADGSAPSSWAATGAGGGGGSVDDAGQAGTGAFPGGGGGGGGGGVTASTPGKPGGNGIAFVIEHMT
ncbi:glycine-rich domain-containing protein [Nocardia wallacei]|uniref:glycine-rich domain-containing protein n=1 Tax=Nocardia wallacei TaxID=480035 RepID=UPI002458EDA8|nr:hypothetical protein [Nocardia wallacei]